ncbi:MAG: ATPase, T2SS/T4P/T4SS family [Candidatus Micrarchaeia archaeon]
MVKADSLGWKIAGKAEYALPELDLNPEEERLLVALLDAFEEEQEPDEGALRALLKKMCARHSLLLGKESAERVLRAATESAGYGPFGEMLADDELEEIAVTGVNEPVRVFHRSRGWLETNCTITSRDYCVNAANRMARSLGRRLTLQSPRLNAVLPNGSRLHATIKPLALNGVELTIRKFREKPFTVPELVENRTLSADAAAFLWLALYGETSLVVAGSTGSGKTTTLNALFSFVPLNDRVVITEETPEINVPHKHKVCLVANEELGIGLKDLVKDSLRMRPDRVIIGEIRDAPEAAALFDSLLSGQARGSYATMHASTGDEALARLKTLGGREDEVNAIDLVLVQRRFLSYDKATRTQSEKRRVTEISEVKCGKARPLYAYVPETDSLERTANYSSNAVFAELSKNYGFDRRGFQAEHAKRAVLLSKNNWKDNAGFTQAVNDYLYG